MEARGRWAPTIRDRVLQMAAKLMIEPIFESDFCDCSYGFRPKRSAHDDVANTLHKGYSHVIDADISKYFDTIPHAELLTVVAERIADGGILHLIKQWLKAPAIEKGKDGKDLSSGGKGNRRGTPQGGVICNFSITGKPVSALSRQDMEASETGSSPAESYWLMKNFA